jgi:hypothetical protein
MKAINRAMDRFIGYLGEVDAAAWDGEADSLDLHHQHQLKELIVGELDYTDLIDLFTADLDTDAWKEFIDSLLLNTAEIKQAAELFAPAFDYDLGD